jgi:hypothetical protein
MEIFFSKHAAVVVVGVKLGSSLDITMSDNAKETGIFNGPRLKTKRDGMW